MPSFRVINGRSAYNAVHSQFHALERHGASFLDRLTEAIREESWKHRLLALAWTAGPVTYVALHVGFKLGYGRQAPRELIIYFAAFTAITGLVSIVASILHKATVEARRKAVRNMVTDVISRLPDLIISVRNLSVMQLSTDKRRLRGVTYLLSDPDATESSIETAIEDLTGNLELARHFRRLESFRKKGLSILVRDEAAGIRRNYGATLEAVAAGSSYIASLLESRLAGRVPSKRIGQRRKYGFLQRIIEAVNEGNEEAIELADTMEMLKLILELLIDREFMVMRWKLSGRHPMVDASKKLEQLVLQRNRLERRIRLAKYRVIQLLDDSINAGPTLYSVSGSDIQDGSYPFTMAAMPKFDIPEDHPHGHHQHVDELTAGLMKIREMSRRLEKLRSREMIVRETFFDLRRQYRLSIPPYGEKEPSPSIAVHFERSSIRLTHKDKIHFAENLQHFMRNLTSNRDRTQLFAETSGEEAQEENRIITTEELQGITLRIFAELENLLDLSEDSIVHALENSPAINVGTIEPGLTRKTKIGWLQAIIEDLEDNESALALKTAKRLVDHFQSNLPASVAQSISDRFGLAREELQRLQPAEQTAE